MQDNLITNVDRFRSCVHFEAFVCHYNTATKIPMNVTKGLRDA